MSEGHKPSEAEINNIMSEMNTARDPRHWDSLNREKTLRDIPNGIKHYADKIESALDDFTLVLNMLEKDKYGEYPQGVYPPEWKGDAEKVKKIQSDIRGKLAELDGLFKLD